MDNLLQIAKENYLKGNRFNACLLLDPESDNTVALSSDTTHRQKTSI
jgi:hypothetical protein